MPEQVGPYALSRIVLCSADASPGAQRDEPGPAEHFFPGAAWVGAMRNAAAGLNTRFVILTTAHGMVESNQTIEPYDLHIHGHEAQVERNWRNTIPGIVGNGRCDILLMYFGGHPRHPALEILRSILADIGVDLVTFGRPNMVDINRVEPVVQMLVTGTTSEAIRAILGLPDRYRYYPHRNARRSETHVGSREEVPPRLGPANPPAQSQHTHRIPGSESRRNRQWAGQADIHTLADAIRREFGQVQPPEDYGWSNAVLNAIDCVLSLHRHYRRFVVPRVEHFRRLHPDFVELAQLRQLMNRYNDIERFGIHELDCNFRDRMLTLQGVVEYLIAVQDQFGEHTEWERLRSWAAAARPVDAPNVRVRGFGLAGFQYLRMLFGANTTKPDVHIRGYISDVIGRNVSDAEALELLEQAAALAQVSLLAIDQAIWASLAAR